MLQDKVKRISQKIKKTELENMRKSKKNGGAIQEVQHPRVFFIPKGLKNACPVRAQHNE